MRYLNGPEMNRVSPEKRSLPRQRTEYSVDDHATPYGCCNYFDACADGIMSLYYRSGSLKLLDWMGFNVSQDCYRVMEFIDYVRPEQSEGEDTAGYISDPCADPNGIEFGGCSLSVEDFGRYGREGPVRDLFKPARYCKTRPRYMYDGSPITDERTWDLTFTIDVMLNDIRNGLITGNDTTGGQFDGLQRWVATGYECGALDSYVVNWNSNAMAGGAGVTINGAAVTTVFDIVEYLLDLVRNIKQRISWSPLLGSQTMQTGDIIILAPGFLIRCLLDFYTCWSVCPGAQYEEVVKNTKDMREFRLTLNGGMFGDGQISLDGMTIPLLQYDWGLINGPTTGDMYVLTGSVGNQRIWEGEHLDANIVLQEVAQLGDSGSGDFSVYDGGRILIKQEFDNLCSPLKVWMRNRLWCAAPWAQVRFQNVRCATPTGPLSPDPSETSFYIESSFTPAECP